MTVVMLNGELAAAESATIPALDRALTHGLGLYETLKLVDGVPVFFDEHIARLEQGLATVGIPRPVTRQELAAQIVRLSAAAGVPNGACRPLVTAGPPGGSPAVLIQVEVRLFPDHPLNLVTFRATRASAGLKSILFMASHVAQHWAVAAEADDAIFVDEAGLLYEATTANLFVWKEDVLSTAPTDGSVLPGVIRNKIMELAAADGVRVAEHYTALDDVTADVALLLTSSVRGIVPAGLLDGRTLRIDEEILRRLRRLVGDAERAAAAAFRERYAEALAGSTR